MDNDYNMAIEYLKNQSFMAMDVEMYQSSTPYLEFCCRRCCFVFNLKKLQKKDHNSIKSFLKEIFNNPKILKIGFNTDRYLRALKRNFKGGFKYENILSIDNELFITNTPSNLDLAKMCQRLFGKPQKKPLNLTFKKRSKTRCRIQPMGPKTWWCRFWRYSLFGLKRSRGVLHLLQTSNCNERRDKLP